MFLIVIPLTNFVNGKVTALHIVRKEKADIITQFNSSDYILNRAVVGKPLLGASSEYLFVGNGWPFRNSWVAGQDILVIRKSMVQSYVVTGTYFYDKIKPSRSDYYVGLKATMQLDSIMESRPNREIIDSLHKVGLIDFSSQDMDKAANRKR